MIKKTSELGEEINPTMNTWERVIIGTLVIIVVVTVLSLLGIHF